MKNVSDEKLNEIKKIVETYEKMLDGKAYEAGILYLIRKGFKCDPAYYTCIRSDIIDECLEHGFEGDISNYECHSLDDDFYILRIQVFKYFVEPDLAYVLDIEEYTGKGCSYHKFLDCGIIKQYN